MVAFFLNQRNSEIILRFLGISADKKCCIMLNLSKPLPPKEKCIIVQFG
jgi:hypothetical protein